MQRQRNNQNRGLGRANAQRQSPNNQRTAIRPRRVARQNDIIASRTFRATSRIFLQSTDGGQGGVQAFFNYSNSVGSYVGAQFISRNFEQYKIENLKVTMKPSSATLNGGTAPANTLESIRYQNSVYSLMNNTEVQSFVDYDTTVTPQSYSAMLARPNLKFRALAPNNWTQIASFTPKTITNPSLQPGAPTNNWGRNAWMSTKNMTALLHSLRGRVSNRSPLFDTQDNVASVDVILTIKVQMRGPKNDPDNLTLPLPMLPYAPIPDDADEEPKEKKVGNENLEEDVEAEQL